jgi:hypothetical protein
MHKRLKMDVDPAGGGGGAAAEPPAADAGAPAPFRVKLEQHRRVLTDVFVHVSEE